MSAPLESQATSVEAGPCRELGEEFTTETFLPLGNDQQELPSRLQHFQSFRRARFARRHAPIHAVTQRLRIVLQNHLPGLLDNHEQTTEPCGHPPHQTWRNHRLMITGLQKRCLLLVSRFNSAAVGVAALHSVTDQTAVVAQRGAIGGAVFVEILPGQRQQARSCETLIGQYESRGGR